MHISLTNELGERRESEIGWIRLSGDRSMCIIDTDSKIQKENVGKALKYI